ncbi:MAG: DEAD/DEAH box helicase, partial [Chloroflexota bacterium]
DGEYALYRQVAVVGVLKEGAGTADVGRMMGRLLDWGSGEGRPPEMPASGEASVIVPSSHVREVTFESRDIDDDALLLALNGQFSGWTSGLVRDRLWPRGMHRARPLMPLKRGHLAQLLAAGYLDNRLIHTDDGDLLVKGQISKTRDPTYQDEGVRKEIERLLVKVNVFNVNRREFVSYSEDRLGEFVGRYRDALISAVVEGFPSEYGVEHRGLMPMPTTKLKRQPIGGQSDAARGLALGLTKHKGVLEIWEMGCGKTWGALAAQQLIRDLASQMKSLKLARICVECPPHMVRKWKREIEITIPGARAVIIRSNRTKGGQGRLSQLHEAMRTPATESRPVFIIMSSQQAKLNYQTRPAFAHSRPRGVDNTDWTSYLCCPDCWKPMVDPDGEPLDRDDLDGRKVKCLCQHCRTAGARTPGCGECCGTVLIAPRVVQMDPGPSFPVTCDRRGANIEDRRGRTATLRRSLWTKMKWDKTLDYGPPAYGRRRGETDLRRTELARFLSKHYGKGRRVCPACGGFDELPTPSGQRRTHICAGCGERTILSRLDLFICDEVHEMAKESTACGRATGVLASISRKALALSGSMYSGYASSLFYILYRFCPEFRRQYRYEDMDSFVAAYGVYEYTYTRIDSADGGRHDLNTEIGVSSKRGAERCTKRERPGMSPAVLLHSIGVAVYLQLEDIQDALPPYREYPKLVQMDPDLATAYRDLDKQLTAAEGQARGPSKKMVAGVARQFRMAYPATCFLPLDREIRVGQNLIRIEAPGLGGVQALEREMFETIQRQVRGGLRCLVYYMHTGERDLGVRYSRIAEEYGLKPAVLRSSVSPENREQWIENRVAEGVNVLFCYPVLVQTGLDLLPFRRIHWAEICDRTDVTRQASRRSWRVIQTGDVEVYFWAYQNTAQVKALYHNARKIQAANRFDGDLVGDGLDELVQDDAVGMLARELFDDGASVTKDSLEALFAASEEYAMSDGQYVDAAFMPADDGARSVVPDARPVVSDGRLIVPVEAPPLVAVRQLAFAPTTSNTLAVLLEEQDRLISAKRARNAARAGRRIDELVRAGQMALFEFAA